MVRKTVNPPTSYAINYHCKNSRVYDDLDLYSISFCTSGDLGIIVYEYRTYWRVCCDGRQYEVKK